MVGAGQLSLALWSHSALLFARCQVPHASVSLSLKGWEIIHMLHEKHCSSWKSGVKISLCSWPFPSLLCWPTAQLAVVLSSLNTLSTVPVWLPANIWAMGKGQGTNSRSPDSHPPSCLSQSGMQRTFPSSCNLSHKTSKPFAAATSVPFLSLRLGGGQVLVGISWALGFWKHLIQEQTPRALPVFSLTSEMEKWRYRCSSWTGQKLLDLEDGKRGCCGQELERIPSQST